MDIILLVLHVVLSLGIITLVLLQKGAGASAGASFGGGGGAGSVFGATGSANFLSKTTAILAVCFFLNSLALAYMAAHREVKTGSVLDVLTAPETEMPAADSTAPAMEPLGEELDVPLADIPEAADVQPAQDGDVPPAEGVETPAVGVVPAEIPPADVPPTDEPQPAGE